VDFTRIGISDQFKIVFAEIIQINEGRGPTKKKTGPVEFSLLDQLTASPLCLLHFLPATDLRDFVFRDFVKPKNRYFLQYLFFDLMFSLFFRTAPTDTENKQKQPIPL
jgi:hypothetical protein